MASARLAAQHDRSTPCSDPGRSEHRSTRQNKSGRSACSERTHEATVTWRWAFPVRDGFLDGPTGSPRRRFSDSHPEQGREKIRFWGWRDRPHPPFLLDGEKKLHRVDSQAGKDDGRERTGWHRALARWHECAFLSSPMHAWVHSSHYRKPPRTHPSIHPSITLAILSLVHGIHRWNAFGSDRFHQHLSELMLHAGSTESTQRCHSSSTVDPLCPSAASCPTWRRNSSVLGWSTSSHT